MDRNTILGFVMMFIVVVGWTLWQQANYEEPPKKPKADTTQISPNVIEDDLPPIVKSDSTEIVPLDDSLASVKKFGNVFAPFTEGTEQFVTIENDLLVAQISSKGGAIRNWRLKNFKKWDGVPTQLIWTERGELFMTFVTFEGIRIDSRDLYFTPNNIQNFNLKITGTDSAEFSFELAISSTKKIIRTYKFYGDKYIFEQDIEMLGMDDIIPPNRGYNLVWEDGIRYQEYSSVDESTEAHALAQMNGDVAEVNADKENEVAESKETGIVDFIALKTKYFGVAIVPEPWQSFDGTADLSGRMKKIKDEGIVERYTISLRVPFDGKNTSRSFKYFIGPLDYDALRESNLQAMVNLGWKYGIRQISEYFMLPIFKFIHRFVPNYGIAIIIFAFIMKLLLHPLSITQMKSAQKMQLLAPEMTRIREKYKDDNTKQQQEIMKLYSEYGVNPVGGCLPMLLQMPILFALWQLLRASLDLRQAHFALWITDLSVYDKIIDWGYPVLGLSHISGLALLMGITMFFQQKLTITDPRQKSMIYIMPVMFTFMFSYFPAGLNLYYFMFNLLSIAQQVYLNKFSKNRPTLEMLKKAPKKDSWLQKKMREAQELAESQGRTLPGAKNQDRDQSGNQKKRPNQGGKKRK
ncbi:MAG: membrane protein insertase YidC [Desulfobulbaceae bacterium]|nr:membrane protein insertase YidC [Desulfobulbaceae bacterium]